MAVNAQAVWECRAAGAGVSDNNGGAWAPLRVSTFSGTDLVVDAAVNTRVTSATHNFVAADVGTRLQISGGTGWTTGFYTILSVAANAANLSASPAPTSTTGGVWTEVGIDYANQNAPQVAIGGGIVTTSITTNVITFTGGTYTPSAADIGNHVQMISGTNVTPNAFFHVTAVGATTWTMDANVVSAGTTVNAVGNMGGAVATIGKLAAKMVASNKAYCTGSFSTTATIAFAQSVTPTGAAPATRLIGYGASRGDLTHAALALSTNPNLTAISATGNGIWIEQFDIDCASLATSSGIIFAGTLGAVKSCKISNFTAKGINSTAASSYMAVIDCELTGGTAAASAAVTTTTGGSLIFRCFIHDNACTGVLLGAAGEVGFCLVVNNSGAASDGIATNFGAAIFNNTIHNNGRHGINQTSGNPISLEWRANILTNNGGFGIMGGITTAFSALPDYDGNAFWSNALGTRSFMDSTTGIYGVAPYVNTRDMILTGSPYVGPTTGTTANFALNDIAGAGQACKSTGSPGTWPGNTGTTGYEDMGAVQHKGGSGVWVITST